MIFKKGDKVKCIKWENGIVDIKLKLGEIYTIKDYYDKKYPILEEFGTYSYFEDRFELVKQEVVKQIDYLQIAKDVCGV